MAVLVEAISVIVSCRAITERFTGGWDEFVLHVPNNTLCYDGYLARVVFLTPEAVGDYVSMLTDNGLVFKQDEQTVDFAVVDQLGGPTIPTSWLHVTQLTLFEPEIRVMACTSVDDHSDTVTLTLPIAWKYEGSISEKYGTKGRFDVDPPSDACVCLN